MVEMEGVLLTGPDGEAPRNEKWWFWVTAPREVK